MLKHNVPQVLFQTLVYPLCLAIRLRVVSSTEAEFDLKGAEDILVELATEDSVPVRYYDYRHAM